jgi:hypothetical protein
MSPTLSVQQPAVLLHAARTALCLAANAGVDSGPTDSSGTAATMAHAAMPPRIEIRIVHLPGRESFRRTAVTATGGAKVQTGPNAVVSTPKSSRGSIPIQNGPTAVITAPASPGAFVRPGAGGNPCTVHCGPLGGSKK